MSGEPVIGLRNVSKIYDENIVAVQGVNLGVNSGEFAFLVGPSGSGKSTLVRLLLKEIEPTSGSVYVNGQRLQDVPRRKVPRHRRSIGCVFQDFKLLPNKTAAENVAYAMEVTGYRRSAIRGTIPQILDLVDLGDKTGRYPDQLSGGEQQRVSIARAFVTRPPIIVADEPTGNIDPIRAWGSCACWRGSTARELRSSSRPTTGR